MNYRVLIAVVSMIIFSPIHGDAKDFRQNKQIKNPHTFCKGGETKNFLTASGTSLTPNLFGSASSSFVPLTFPNDIFIQGDGIKAKSNTYEFTLEKGLYVVSFTGGFQIINSGLSIAWEIALKTGPQIHTPFTDSTYFFDTTCFTKAIRINKKTDLSIVVRNITPNSALSSFSRTISIIRKGD